MPRIRAVGTSDALCYVASALAVHKYGTQRVTGASSTPSINAKVVQYYREILSSLGERDPTTGGAGDTGYPDFMLLAIMLAQGLRVRCSHLTTWRHPLLNRRGSEFKIQLILGRDKKMTDTWIVKLRAKFRNRKVLGALLAYHAGGGSFHGVAIVRDDKARAMVVDSHDKGAVGSPETLLPRNQTIAYIVFCTTLPQVHSTS